MPQVSEKQLIIKKKKLQIQHKGSEALWEALEDTYFSDSETGEIGELGELRGL